MHCYRSEFDNEKRVGGAYGDVGETGGKETRVGVGFVVGLDEDPDHAAEGGADGHGGDEYSRGDFAAVGDDNQDHADYTRPC